jgi:hypothetical protein
MMGFAGLISVLLFIGIPHQRSEYNMSFKIGQGLLGPGHVVLKLGRYTIEPAAMNPFLIRQAQHL